MPLLNQPDVRVELLASFYVINQAPGSSLPLLLYPAIYPQQLDVQDHHARQVAPQRRALSVLPDIVEDGRVEPLSIPEVLIQGGRFRWFVGHLCVALIGRVRNKLTYK